MAAFADDDDDDDGDGDAYGTGAPEIAAPDSPDAPVLETPADLTAYARDHAGVAGTIPGPSCMPERSTMLGHARYGDTAVAVVRLLDEHIAAITLDDCEIVATTE